MGKKIKIFLITISVIILLIFIYGFMFFSKIEEPRCKIWKSIYISEKKVNSQEKAKSFVVDFLNFHNVTFNEEKLRVKNSGWNKYEVSYYVCGWEDIQSFPTGNTFPFGFLHRINNTNIGPACSTIIYKIEENQIIGNHLNPC